MAKLFQEIKSVPRSRQIVDTFRKAIAEGIIKVGDRLPPERELCMQLGVSRTSLREAIRILEAYGIIETRQGGGTFVTDRFTENVFEFLGFGSHLTKQHFYHLLDVRAILEVGAVAAIIEAIQDESIHKLEQLIDALEKSDSSNELGFLDAKYHEALIELSGNPILIALYKMIFKMLLQATSAVISYPTAKSIAVRDHRIILKALQEKNIEYSKQMIQQHLIHTRNIIETYY
jgi:GntR family transcriptional repressor for pyruvate dehydrogenase complex